LSSEERRSRRRIFEAMVEAAFAERPNGAASSRADKRKGLSLEKMKLFAAMAYTMPAAQVSSRPERSGEGRLKRLVFVIQMVITERRDQGRDGVVLIPQGQWNCHGNTPLKMDIYVV